MREHFQLSGPTVHSYTVPVINFIIWHGPVQRKHNNIKMQLSSTHYLEGTTSFDLNKASKDLSKKPLLRVKVILEDGPSLQTCYII